MKDLIRYQDKYYILANSSIVEEQSRILKNDAIFGIFDFSGNIRPFGCENHGIYCCDTRFLSRMLMSIEDVHPILLDSTVRHDNRVLTVNMTNPNFIDHNNEMIERGTIHILSSISINGEMCNRNDQISNFGKRILIFHITYEFDADFIDIFEVRGIKRKKHGEKKDTSYYKDRIIFSYMGLDDINRTTEVSFSVSPESIKNNIAQFELVLQPGKSQHCLIKAGFKINSKKNNTKNFYITVNDGHKEQDIEEIQKTVIDTSSKTFNKWLKRSRSDIAMMLSRTACGYYPFAGIPWYNTVFGRDGIITAIMTLCFYPEISRGVLLYLAKTQSKITDDKLECEPGKILHEQRMGEMANLREIPFGSYYGSVDSTPLFLILAGNYLKRTADIGFIREIWPEIYRATKWLDKYGDIDKDGFIEYKQQNIDGLSQQGWRDSWNAVYHRNGQIPEYPIALSEVQGYVYDAKLQISRIAKALGKDIIASELKSQAAHLKSKFIKSFWQDDSGILAMALDGNKQPCLISCSSSGHSLFSGIVTKKIAGKITDRLLSNDFYSGWGIRTIAESEPGYNPMSYHNGSVWPHDNAMIAYGMTKYGHNSGALRILNSLFDASQLVEIYRIPELFCGFIRKSDTGPTLYPLGCRPQSWSAASVFLLLQAITGLEIDAQENKVYLIRPLLPHFLTKIKIQDLDINGSKIDLTLLKSGKDIGIFSDAGKNGIEVVIRK